MLKVENLSLRLGSTQIIRDISFEVSKGELVCLLGPSGCGKTTTLRLIAGLEKPDSGTISIAGERASGSDFVLPPHKRHVGFLFQDFALFPHLTVAENISYGLAHLGKAAAQARTKELLEQIRMLHHADKYPHELSGGEQQRVAFARARAPRPPLLLLDEPFSGLDTSLRGRIREETLRILHTRGVTAVMVTHDPEEAMMMADRIILMKDGETVQVGTPDEIYNHPVSPFAAEFLGEINRLKGTADGDRIETDIGSLANAGFADGTSVDVMVRPDALKLSPGAGAAPGQPCARVCDVRYAGGSSHIRLGLGEGEVPHTHVQVRRPGRVVVHEGERLGVEIDPSQTFVFQSSD